MSFCLVYVSSAAHLFSRAELDEILFQSHRNNLRTGITGALLYKDGNVMQVLEGEELTVRELFSQITVDPRHKGVIIVAQQHQPTRQFGQWSMAFQDLTSPDVMAHPGYSDFLNSRLSSEEFTSNPTMCHRLLASFKRSMAQ